MNPDHTINLNQNAADCIKSASKFGETIYTNICNGNVSHVAWGGADWVGVIFLMALVAAVILMIGSMALMMISDW